MVYKTVIILAPGIVKDDSGDQYFKNDSNELKYKITDDQFEFRFKAAKRLHELGVSRFVLVGGVVKDAPSISKPDVMENLLVTKYNMPLSCIIKVVSESNTEGNVKAVKEYLADNKIDRGLGLLTNFFHLPRAVKQFSEFTDLIFSPICAESVVYDIEYENIRLFFANQGLELIIGSDPESKSEIKGLFQKEMGTYKSGIS